ncbi:MAG: polynucleotide adenylyltransferase PcnB [bacterium]
MTEPTIIPRSDHCISRDNISNNALKVLYRLSEVGYQAYLVGGGVRDLLLGKRPKDFDIATDATPEEVKGLFRNCRLIGRRFRLAHVHYGREIIEVATFRAPHEEAEADGVAASVSNGRITRDNVYGTLEQDVWRRDFTVNALYYNISDFSVIDFVGGMADLENGVLRMLGDAETRYREDPVRALRAARFAAKLGFELDESTDLAIEHTRHMLAEAAPARLFDELLKLMHGGHAVESFLQLRYHHLFEFLFPQCDALLDQEGGDQFGWFIRRALENTDRRINNNQPVTPAFLVAVMLWGSVKHRMDELADEEPPAVAVQIAGQEAISETIKHIAVPKRFSIAAREIWALQNRLTRLSGKQPFRLIEHPRFRAAYDFLCLRASSGDQEVEQLCQWWTEFQEEHPVPVVKGADKRASAARRRPRSRRRSRPPAS